MRTAVVILHLELVLHDAPKRRHCACILLLPRHALLCSTMAWSLDSYYRQYFRFALACPFPLGLPLCCFVFACCVFPFFSVTFFLGEIWTCSPHPATSLSPSVIALTVFGLSLPYHPLSRSYSWLCAAFCSHGAKPSGLGFSSASPSAGSFPPLRLFHLPCGIVLHSWATAGWIPHSAPLCCPPGMLLSGFAWLSFSLLSGFPVISSIGVLLRSAACLQTLPWCPLVLLSGSPWYVLPVRLLCLFYAILIFWHFFFKRSSAASARLLNPKEQHHQQQYDIHRAALPCHQWWFLPLSLHSLQIRRSLLSSAAAAPAATSTLSTPGAAAPFTATVHAVSAAESEADIDFTAALRVAADCSASFASLSSTCWCKSIHIHCYYASTRRLSVYFGSASANAAVAVHSAAAAVAVQSAHAAVQAAASRVPATPAQSSARGAGDFLSAAAGGAGFGRSRAAVPVPYANPKNGVLTRFFLTSVATAAADYFPALHLLCVGAALWQETCSSGKQKRRSRLSCHFYVLRRACDVVLLAAFLTITAGSCGCGGKRHSNTSSHSHESPVSPCQRLYVPILSFHAPLQSSASAQRFLDSSARTLRRCSGTLQAPRPSVFPGVLFAICELDHPCFSSSLPLFFLFFSGPQLSSSPVPHHLKSDKEKRLTPLTSCSSHSRACSDVSALSFPLPATYQPGNLGCATSPPAYVPFVRRLPSSSSPRFHFWPFGLLVPRATGPAGVASSLDATVVDARSSFRVFAFSSHQLPVSSPPPSAHRPRFSNHFSGASSLWQPPAPIYSSRSPRQRIPTNGLCSRGHRPAFRENGPLNLCLAAVRRHGRPGTSRETTRHVQQVGEEEEEALSRLPYIPPKGTEEARRQQAGDTSMKQRYDFLTGPPALPPEDEEGGDRSQQLRTILQKTTRFGSLTDPGEPPTPPPPSPFWPSYPPKKVSPLPRGSLPRWHPRSPFPSLQPRGPFYPQQDEQHQQQKQQLRGSIQEQKNQTEKREQMKENDTDPGACFGVPEEPPGLPKNYRNWVRDSRYKYPQFTTLPASLKYRRHLKRSSRKLDWRLKNVQSRRMYFAWRRNMRDQEMHRWMREKIRWSKLAAEYWKREYSRQEEEWRRKMRLEPQIKEEGAPSQETAEASPAMQKRRPEEEGKPQIHQGTREGSFAVDGPPNGEVRISWEVYSDAKEDRMPTEAHGTERVRSPGAQQQTSKTWASCSAERHSPASLSALDTETSERKPIDKPTSESGRHRREEGKAAREQRKTEEDRRVEEECLKSRDEVDTGEKSGREYGGNTTLRDLASRVLSVSSPQEIKDIIINGYRLPPLTAAVAASPIPWWASCKGEHKWRGKKTATNVQSRWVNWANPHRLVEAAVGRCLLPREGGALEVLRAKGKKLEQTLKRVQRIEDAAAWCRYPKAGEQEESAGAEQSLDGSRNEEQLIDKRLREMWKRKKMQQRQEGREREGAAKVAEVDKGKAQRASLREADSSTVRSSEQAGGEDEAGGREPRGDKQNGTAEKKKQHEATAAGEVEEAKRENAPFADTAPPEGARRSPIETEETKNRFQSLSSSAPAAQVKNMAYFDIKETYEGTTDRESVGQSAQQSRDTPVESLIGCSNASSVGHTSDTSTGRNMDRLCAKNFLDDPEKQRKAIEASIDVSLMLGHSTIVKSQGATVPYDVHSPFMRSHTSSRRRRMRLRGRGRGPDKRNMTRQERRLANRDERLEREKQRKEAARAARRRTWEESQRLQSAAEPEV